MEFATFVKRVSREELGQDKCGPAAEENWFHWHDRASERQWPSIICLFARRNFEKKIEFVEELICSRKNVLHTHKSLYETERETAISRSSVRRIQSTILQLKIYSACHRSYCHSLEVATLFSKIVSNELRISVKNEITLIHAKFGVRD